MSAAGAATAPGRLAGKIVLVTGASRGLGRAVAERIAAEGAHLILVARTSGALEEADDAVRACGGSATLVPLDLTDFAALDRLGAALHERHGRLDALVAAAGELGVLGPLPHLAPEVFERTLAVNATAAFRLIRSLDPLLRAAPAGRAVFVTGGVPEGMLAAYWGAYAAGKAALEALVRSYAAEIAHTALRVNLVDPGPMRTRLRERAFPGEDAATLAPPETVANAFVALIEPACRRHGETVRLR